MDVQTMLKRGLSLLQRQYREWLKGTHILVINARTPVTTSIYGGEVFENEWHYFAISARLNADPTTTPNPPVGRTTSSRGFFILAGRINPLTGEVTNVDVNEFKTLLFRPHSQAFVVWRWLLPKDIPMTSAAHERLLLESHLIKPLQAIPLSLLDTVMVDFEIAGPNTR